MALTDKLTAIADAIRGKTGKTEGLTLDAMPGEIEAIQTGGGGDTSQVDALVARTIEHYYNDRITYVGAQAFRECRSLKSIDLPNLEEVGASCFHTTGLETLNAPKLKTIGGEAFRLCPMTTLWLPNFETTTGMYAFRSSGLTEMVLPKFKNGKDNRIFYGCSKLEKADFYVVSTIGNLFDGCSSLRTIIIRTSDKICTLTNTTSAHVGTPVYQGTGNIYVPAALIEEYKVATNWSAFAEQFRAIEDYPEICGEVIA